MSTGDEGRGGCCTPDCPNKAARGGKCWTHIKRAKRGIPTERAVRGYRMTKQERLGKAIARYTTAETDAEFQRAAHLVEKYASGATGRKGVAAIVRRTVTEAVRELERKLKKPPG